MYLIKLTKAMPACTEFAIVINGGKAEVVVGEETLDGTAEQLSLETLIATLKAPAADEGGQ